MTLSLQQLVDGLDAEGEFGLYTHRVAWNPVIVAVGSGTGENNYWMAEVACKISFPVEFSCQDDRCVEVTTIVCSHFAGMSTDPAKPNHGHLHIVCKVPPTHLMVNPRSDNADCSQLIGGATPNAVLTPTPSPCCDSEDPNVPINACNSDWISTNGAAGVVSGNSMVYMFETPGPIPEDSTVAGKQSLRGNVRIQRADGTVSNAVTNSEIYSAAYNLTRASAQIGPISLPLAVGFRYTSLSESIIHAGVSEKDETIEQAVARVIPSFPAPTGGPLLMSYEIENGEITGMLRDVAYQSNTQEFWNATAALCDESDYRLGGSFFDGKGQPAQVSAVSHGCPTTRFNNVNVINTARKVG
jgi:hypothetical protein